MVFHSFPDSVGRWPRFLAVLCALLTSKRTAYRDALKGVYVNTVLADLRKFCRADDATFTPGDPHTTSFLEGRREVWNRIRGFLRLTADQLDYLEEMENDDSDGED